MKSEFAPPRESVPSMTYSEFVPPAGSQSRAWHSVKQDVHHNNAACRSGLVIEIAFLREGTGGRPLCQECAALNAHRG